MGYSQWLIRLSDFVMGSNRNSNNQIAWINQACLEELNRLEIRLLLISHNSSVANIKHAKACKVLRWLYAKSCAVDNAVAAKNYVVAKRILRSTILDWQALCSYVRQNFPEEADKNCLLARLKFFVKLV